MARPNRWIDGPCLSTAATRLSRNIAIWKWQGEPGHEPWVKQIVIPPLPGHAKNIQQANGFPPLPLFLKAGHYIITLKPSDSPFPPDCHDNPAHARWDAGDNRGGAKSYGSWLPPTSPSSVKNDAKRKPENLQIQQLDLVQVGCRPAPLPVLSMMWTQGMVRRHRAMQHPTRVGCQLAPPLAISKLIGNVYRNPMDQSRPPRKRECSISRSAKGAASSSAVSAPAPKRKGVGPDPPKVGSKPFAFEKGIRRLGRPPKGVKTKKMDRKTAMKMFHQSHLVWVGPECQTKFEGRYGSVIRSKWHHWKSRRPEKSTDLISRPKITIFEVSHELPQDQQAWSCPLCTAALPSLPDQDRKRAIKKHCQDCHPDHSLQDLAHLRIKKTERTPKMPENNARSGSNFASKSLRPMSQSKLRFLSSSKGNEVPPMNVYLTMLIAVNV